ncbi:hypothetical protein SCOR_34210 [Sulfidibacter corallicola]|uniref:Uncharacterized protein n=1 Tax=Sulfidibacter corallicola TaxID=2818388 RepID=A0A8A4TKK4_SULCO|nr:hypothetical protein [Sulfidibacter corallicola]QTD49411.1 hypothetical protein J3U87_27820 [Sulfidibacter corallicola]
MNKVKVVFGGWEEGFAGISLTKALLKFSEMRFRDAKINTDLLLDGKRIEIWLKERGSAERLIKEARSCGVQIAEIQNIH